MLYAILWKILVNNKHTYYLPTGRIYRRGRPPLEYIRKCLRAKANARAKVKEAANNDVDLLLHTARVTSTDKNLKFVLKEMGKDPSLSAWIKDKIKNKKKGLGL